MSVWQLPKERVFEEMKSDPRGLSDTEAAARLKRDGPNRLEKIRKTPLVFRFLANFYNLFAILLWVGAILSYIGGMPQLGYAIVGVIVINAVFSFWQEYRAEKAVEALKKLLPARARVTRGGTVKEILAEELVVGDLVLLEEGDNVSADARLIEEYEMRVNNSTLSGESNPARRTADAVKGEGLHTIEIPNLIFAGTSVATGTGRALVYATGMRTEFGRIAHLTQAIKEDLSPLQKEMALVTKIVAFFSVGMGVLFYFLGAWIGGLTQLESFLFMIGIIVANVPEGLLPTVTLSLALGVQRMARRKALVKKLSAVETLGSTNVILTDKTGTLTMNQMAVREIWSRAPRQMRLSGILCNNAKFSAGGKIIGDPTEGALLLDAKKNGLDPEQVVQENPRISLLPFDSRRKRMTSINKDSSGRLSAHVKGAPREVIALCDMIQIDGEIKPLTAELRAEILAANDRFARSALRVLCLAYRLQPGGEVERELIFLGLAALMDPPRPEVEAAVKNCEKAGIRVIMITGDYGLTAEAIARKIGIIKGDCRIINGVELDAMSDEQLSAEIENKEVVFARVNPEHKLRVVSVLKAKKKIVAVTGDGVNDAPALRKADIGVAMGIAGVDVAREASELILLDDNFATIVTAIEEGRTVYNNIKKFVTYIFSSNIPEIIPFILFVLFKIPLPLTIMQILAVDLGTDMVPALALGVEKPEPGIMGLPPRSWGKRLLDFPLLARAYGWLGLIEGAAAMAGFYYMYVSRGWRPGEVMAGSGPVYLAATTMCLAAIVTSQIGNGLACRTERISTFAVGIFSNRFFLFGVLAELAIINLLIYFPPLAKVFGLYPLALRDWAFLFLFTPTIFFLEELRKLIFRWWYNKGGAKA